MNRKPRKLEKGKWYKVNDLVFARWSDGSTDFINDDWAWMDFTSYADDDGYVKYKGPINGLEPYFEVWSIKQRIATLVLED